MRSETDEIPLDRGLASGLDELTGATPALVNMLVAGPPGAERARAVRSRPGIRAWPAGPTAWPSTAPVVAMTLLGGRLVYVTDDGAGVRKVFGIDAGGTVIDMSLAGGDSLIAGTAPIAVVTWRDFAFAVGGGEPEKISTGFAAARLGGAPPDAVDACTIAQRLVLVRTGNRGTFYWNRDPGEAGSETWDTTLDFAESEARADALVACESTSGELFTFGAETTQIWVPDPSRVFAPVATLELGAVNVRGCIRIDQTMAWAATDERLVSSDGRSVEVLSDNGLAATVSALTRFDDCWAFRCKIGAFDVAAWVFPNDGVTFAWDMNSKTWSEWRRKDAATGRFLPWAPTSYIKAFGRHLVGMPDGTICELTLDAHTDMGDPIGWVARTGFREVAKRRHTVRVAFPCRRGEAATTSASVQLRWRDDLGPWTPPVNLPLGVPGDYQAEIVQSPVGPPFRRREYELSGDANEAYLLTAGKETFEEAEV